MRSPEAQAYVPIIGPSIPSEEGRSESSYTAPEAPEKGYEERAIEAINELVARDNERAAERYRGPLLGKAREWFDREGRRREAETLDEVGAWEKNAKWKKWVKIGAKVAGGAGIATAMVMTGGAGAILTPILWSMGMREAVNGAMEAVEEIGWGRKRSQAELGIQGVQSQAIQNLKERVRAGDLNEAEFQQLVNEMLETENQVMAQQATNLKGERRGRLIRSIASSVVTVGAGLFAGVPLGTHDYDGLTKVGETTLDQAHKVFFNVQGGQYLYNNPEELMRVAEQVSTVGEQFMPWNPTSIYGQAAHSLGHGLGLAEKLGLAGAAAYLAGRSLEEFMPQRGQGRGRPSAFERPRYTPPTVPGVSYTAEEAPTPSPAPVIARPAGPRMPEPRRAAPATPETPGETEAAAEEPSREKERNQEAAFSIRELDPEEAEAIFERLELPPNSYFRGQRLTPERLAQNNIFPQYEVVVDGKRVWASSNQFKFENRIGGLAFIEQDDGRITTAPYLGSGSQAVFRFYPGFEIGSSEDPDKEYIRWFSKGHGEEGLALPIMLQKALAEAQIDMVEIDHDEAGLILVGASNRFEDRIEAMQEGAKFSGVDPKARTIDGIQPGYFGNLEQTPEQINLTNSEDSPDFSNVVTRWEENNPLYGQITKEVFDSKNGNLRYLFCRDDTGRAWIGAIELTQAPINHRGLKQQWVDAGVLLTPAYEYDDQLKDKQGRRYANYGVARAGYTDAYENFLSQLPIIQDYQQSLGERQGKPTQGNPDGSQSERRAETDDRQTQIQQVIEGTLEEFDYADSLDTFLHDQPLRERANEWIEVVHLPDSDDNKLRKDRVAEAYWQRLRELVEQIGVKEKAPGAEEAAEALKQAQTEGAAS